MKILLIDDSWEFTESVKDILETDGCIVDVIDESDDAYNVITNKDFLKYDLILLDLMLTVGEKFQLKDMPEVGIFLYYEIRKYNQKIPIIIVSALNKMQFDKHFHGDEFVKYVSKPCNIEELEIAIGSFSV